MPRGIPNKPADDSESVTFRTASEFAAYEIAEGVTDGEQAFELGLIAVESDAFGKPIAWGRYP